MPDLAGVDGGALGLQAGLGVFAFLATAGCLAILATRGHRQRPRFQGILFLTAFALRFAASVALYHGGLIHVVGAEDDGGWVRGVALHRAWAGEGRGISDLPAAFAESYRTHHDGYYYLLGVVLHFVPASRLTAAALNGLLGAIAVVLVYRTARGFAPERAAALAGWLTCGFPSLVLWSALTIKEPVVLLLSVVAVHCCTRVRAEGLSPRHLAALAASIVLLVPFRLYTAWVAAVAVVGLVLPRFDGRRMAPGSLAGGIALASALLLSGVLTPHLGGPQSKFEDPSLGNVQFFRAVTGDRGGSPVPSRDNLHTARGFATALSVGAAHLLLAPPLADRRGGAAGLPRLHGDGRVVAPLARRGPPRPPARGPDPVRRGPARPGLRGGPGYGLQPALQQHRPDLPATVTAPALAPRRRGGRAGGEVPCGPWPMRRGPTRHGMRTWRYLRPDPGPVRAPCGNCGASWLPTRVTRAFSCDVAPGSPTGPPWRTRPSGMACSASCTGTWPRRRTASPPGSETG